MAKKKVWHCNAQVLSVHDGDTFKARIDLLEERDIEPAQKVDLGFRLFLEAPAGSDAIAGALAAGVHLTTEMNVRLFDVGAPELKEAGGPESARYLATLLPIGSTVRLESKRLDKYGRCEAVVTLANGLNLNEATIKSGFARAATASGYDKPPGG